MCHLSRSQTLRAFSNPARRPGPPLCIVIFIAYYCDTLLWCVKTWGGRATSKHREGCITSLSWSPFVCHTTHTHTVSLSRPPPPMGAGRWGGSPQATTNFIINSSTFLIHNLVDAVKHNGRCSPEVIRAKCNAFQMFCLTVGSKCIMILSIEKKILTFQELLFLTTLKCKNVKFRSCDVSHYLGCCKRKWIIGKYAWLFYLIRR